MSAIVARQPGALSLSARRGQSVVGSGCGRLVRQTATTAAAPRCLSARAPRVTTSTALLTPHPPALLSALLPSRSPSFPLLLPVVLSSRFSNLVLERHELAPHFSIRPHFSISLQLELQAAREHRTPPWPRQCRRRARRWWRRTRRRRSWRSSSRRRSCPTRPGLRRPLPASSGRRRSRPAWCAPRSPAACLR